MAGKLDEYEKILRELSLRVDETDQLMIQKSLDHVSDAADVLRSGRELTDVRSSCWTKMNHHRPQARGG